MILLTLCFVGCFIMPDIEMDYIDVNVCTTGVNYFHFLSTNDRGFFSLCVRILSIIAKEKASHEKDA